MQMLQPRVPRVIELADRIAADIRRRKLSPGDPYQTTLETADMLGVSTTAANRAMQVLAKRRVVERRQRKGTFIAHPPTSPAGDATIVHVHLLVQEGHLRHEALLSDGIVVGIHDELPSAQLSLDFLPADDEAKTVDSLISQGLKSGTAEGFILVRTSLSVQRQMANSGLPTVVYGMLHPSVHPMPWIDRDHVSAGRLLVGHLLKNGVKRVLVLMRDRLLQGDHVLLDATRDALHQGGLPMNALTIRGLPNDHEAIVASVSDWMFATAAMGPAGIICRSEPLAKGVEQAMSRGKGRAVVVLSDYYRKGFEAPPAWAHVRLELAPEQIGAHIGRMLGQQARRERVSPPHEVIAVRLEQ